MRLNLFFLLGLLVVTNWVLAQNDSLRKYHSPLEIPLILSANFGELRPNHFHMGIDFKTNGQEGIKLLAIDDGYVSRIKISPYGYGKAVYINHPNGLTSVYAHCSALIGKLDSIVKLTQEKEQNFEIEIFPNKDDIPLKKGENFALSGNSGSSTAPHLHFEIRNTITETALNPLTLGFDIIDTKAPEIKSLKIYGVTEKGYRIQGKSKVIPVFKGKFGHYVGGDLVSVPSDFQSEKGGIGIAFEVSDTYDQSQNTLGIYGSYLLVNQDTIFGHQFDSLSFETTKHINSHADYEEFSKSKRKYQKAFKTFENPLTIYHNDNLGILKMLPLDTLDIKYIAYDTKKNKSEIRFKMNLLSGNKMEIIPTKATNYLYPDSSFTFNTKDISIFVPEGCVYEPTQKNFISGKIVKIGSSNIPIQKTIQLKFKLNNPILPPEKYYISVNSNYLKTSYSDNYLRAEAKNLGTYSILFDTIAPSISPFNFLKTDTITKKEILQWKISDNKTSIQDYDLFIDQKWYLLEYETKGSFLIFRRPNDLLGKHFLKIVAKDGCGNTVIWEKEMWFE